MDTNKTLAVKDTVAAYDQLPAPLAAAFAEGSPMQQLLGRVLNELGGVDAVVDWAEENMNDFMRLLMAASPPPAGPQIPGIQNNTHLHVHPALVPGPLDVVSEQ